METAIRLKVSEKKPRVQDCHAAAPGPTLSANAESSRESSLSKSVCVVERKTVTITHATTHARFGTGFCRTPQRVGRRDGSIKPEQGFFSGQKKIPPFHRASGICRLAVRYRRRRGRLIFHLS